MGHEHGEMAKQENAPDSRSGGLLGCAGSSPALSTNQRDGYTLVLKTKNVRLWWSEASGHGRLGLVCSNGDWVETRATEAWRYLARDLYAERGARAEREALDQRVDRIERLLAWCQKTSALPIPHANTECGERPVFPQRAAIQEAVEGEQ